MCHDPADTSHAPRPTREERVMIEDGSVPLFWFDPDKQLAAPIRVVVLPDMRGPHAFYRSLAGRLAGEGIQTTLLDYLWRLPEVDSNDIEAARERRKAFDQSKGLSDIASCIRLLTQRDTAPIVLMGFCLGGTLAMFAQMRSKVSGSIVYYGLPRPTRPKSLLEPYSVLDVLLAGAPLLGFWGEEEKSVDLKSVEELDRKLDEFEQPHQIVRYPGVGHAFLTFDPQSPDYPASADSWTRSMQFLLRLSKGQPPLVEPNH